MPAGVTSYQNKPFAFPPKSGSSCVMSSGRGSGGVEEAVREGKGGETTLEGKGRETAVKGKGRETALEGKGGERAREGKGGEGGP